MKLLCEREKLLHAFQMAASVVPIRSPKPVLRNIKIEVTPETTFLIATDLEVGTRIELTGVEVETGGSALLPVKQFGNILRESSDEKLTIESDDQRIQVLGQHSEFQLPVEDPASFPALGKFSEKQYHKISARFFREMVRRTAFATDVDNSRYALGGVLIDLGENSLTAVGTDGRRLAKQTGVAEAVGDLKPREGNTIIPTRAMSLMERAMADNEESVQVAIRENDVLVQSQRTMIYSRLVEGRFPRWEDVFPKQEELTKLELLVGSFYAAVRQAAIVTSDKQRGVDFTFDDGKIVLVAHGAELGDSHVELPVSYEGPKIVITLDPRFLADFLKVLNADSTITLKLKGPDTAAVCSTDDGYDYVIMPLARPGQEKK